MQYVRIFEKLVIDKIIRIDKERQEIENYLQIIKVKFTARPISLQRKNQI